MEKLEKVRCLLTYVGIFIIATMLVTACKPNPQKVLKQRYTSVSQTLQQTGKFAEDTFYACLINGLAQGLPLTQVSDDCATQLIGPDGSNPGGGFSFPGGGSPFDPASVSANCSSGDPSRSQTQSARPVGYPSSSIPGMGWTKVGGMEGFSYGSYGGKGIKEKGEDGKEYEYVGLSKEESMAQKEAAMKEASAALQKYQELRDAARKETDPAKKADLETKAKAAEKEWEEKHKEASKDPNKKEPGIPNSRTAGEGSVCESVLQSARETLRECNRNGWKSYTCQSLAAKMNHCPDPARIFVDPDAGYSCGAAIDAEAVKDAWVQQCQELVKYGPGGDNPCKPPNMYGNGRYVQGNSGDICSDPRAMVNPESGVCIRTLEVKNPVGQPGIQELIVLALDKIGGPIVVLPLGPKPPRPGGPDPRPGPR